MKKGTIRSELATFFVSTTGEDVVERLTASVKMFLKFFADSDPDSLKLAEVDERIQKQYEAALVILLPRAKIVCLDPWLVHPLIANFCDRRLKLKEVQSLEIDYQKDIELLYFTVPDSVPLLAGLSVSRTLVVNFHSVSASSNLFIPSTVLLELPLSGYP